MKIGWFKIMQRGQQILKKEGGIFPDFIKLKPYYIDIVLILCK